MDKESHHLDYTNVNAVPAGENVEETDAYGGPMVETLDPEFTHLLTEYLAERKVSVGHAGSALLLHERSLTGIAPGRCATHDQIDADMSYFIGQYSQQKESEEYVNFCRKFAEFLKK